MNKRSAMLMAAGLVLTLIVGGVAMSIGLTGPTSSEATPRAERRQYGRADRQDREAHGDRAQAGLRHAGDRNRHIGFELRRLGGRFDRR